MGGGGAVGGGKRTPEITKAFERQVQYRRRRRDYRVDGGNAGGGMLEMKKGDLTK